MLHIFERFIDEKNEGAGIFGMITSSAIIMFIFEYGNKMIVILGFWGPFIATLMGMVGTVITGMVMILAKNFTEDFYKEKIKNKYFKPKKDDKETDNQKAA